MSTIQSIHAREILDSRGNPTVEVELTTDKGIMARADVPSGASTGAHEACELRDEDPNRYLGKGVLKACKNITDILAPKLIGVRVSDQANIDQIMIETDNTENKTRMGANAILGISLAAAKAAALSSKQPLYRYIGGVSARKIPVGLMNVLNGGVHANNGLDVQEFMIVPMIKKSFRESLRAGSEIFNTLKKILAKKGLSTAVGDEGGFAPKLTSNEDALKLLMEAIQAAGYEPGQDVFVALDVAATELYKDGKYRWEGNSLTAQELLGVYSGWSEKYPLISIEDGFSEDDWTGWIQATKELGSRMQLVGDDLFVTNPKRIKQGLEKKAANALLVKVNQIGSLTETAAAVNLAQQNKFQTVMSHRSGETEDAVIADLAVGFNCSQIKTGSLCRSERTAKYNQLLRIEEELAGQAEFWDKSAFSR